MDEIIRLFKLPFISFLAIKVMDPITNAILLIERCSRAAHVWDTAAILVAHMKQHALEFLVSVKSKRAVGAVEGESDVRELFPTLSLLLWTDGNWLITRSVQNKKGQKKNSVIPGKKSWMPHLLDAGPAMSRPRRRLSFQENLGNRGESQSVFICTSVVTLWLLCLLSRENNLPKAMQRTSATWRIILNECRLSCSGC